MAKILHTQKGLTIKRNSKNGFTVVTLHFTADPRKRSEAWLREAKQGMNPAKFNQEYNIDYTAMFGERVFPEIKERRKEIVVPSPFTDNGWPKDLPMWGGFDYGTRNPSSFHVYAVLDGVLYAIWELYEPCKNIFDFASKMLQCPFWPQIKYVCCDPDIDTLKQRDMRSGNMTSVKQQFIEAGIRKMVNGGKDEEAWLGLMRTHWGGEHVTFCIQDNCPEIIREFEEIVFVSMSDRQLETQNYREVMVNRHNHALDDCKYFMNTKPRLNVPSVSLPTLVKRYTNW